MEKTMEQRAREWRRNQTGHAEKLTDYSFEFVEGQFSAKEGFKETKRYVVMKSFFFGED